MGMHVMVDLETWSTAKNATIISLGAVKFDPWDPNVIMDRFHVGVDPDLLHANVRRLFDIDPSTLKWWMAEERKEALAAWLLLEKVDLGTALEGFAEWYGPKPLPTWGNAPSFDCVILAQSYALLGLPCPFGYRDEMDYRTMKKLAPGAPRPDDSLIVHDALQDATWQALHLQSIFRALMVAEPAHGDPPQLQGTYTLNGETATLGVTAAPLG